MNITREQKKAQTREAILDAAVTLFGRRGFENTSIEALAKKAGIGKGTIYTYFRKKTDILKAFCEEELEYVRSQLAQKTNPATPFVEQMHTIFFAEFQYLSKNREFGRILMRELLFPHKHPINGLSEVDSGYFEMLFPLIEAAKKKGELRDDLPPLYVAGHFYALFLLMASSWYTGRVATEEIDSGMYELFEQTMIGLRPVESN